jgi:light-regulated signal transduction histidine kinase (bacteriophytochrome)
MSYCDAGAGLEGRCRELEERVRQLIFELGRANADLERKNRELQDFGSVASHDLQEPLRKIQAFGDLLQRRFGDVLNEEGCNYIDRMQRGAASMQAMLHALLSYSRITSRAQPFTLVDLNHSVREALNNLRAQIAETNARVEAERLPRIEAEPAHMIELLQNLIGNSLKFRREKEPPVIKISAEPAEGSCRIFIRDNGIGFQKKYLDRIFIPFERLHTHKYKGTGIGLSLARKIVERHGGSITAESLPDIGSTFIVTLPERQRPYPCMDDLSHHL